MIKVKYKILNNNSQNNIKIIYNLMNVKQIKIVQTLHFAVLPKHAHIQVYAYMDRNCIKIFVIIISNA